MPKQRPSFVRFFSFCLNPPKFMFIILSISSKNLSSLTTFLKFLYKLKTNKTFRLKFYTTQSQKKKSFSFFSVLQSPHVNKKSQEQFEYTLHCKKLKIYIPHLTKFLTALKIIKTALFLDIRVEIKCWLDNKPFKSYLLNKTNSDKFRLKLLTKNTSYQNNLDKWKHLKKPLRFIYSHKNKKDLSSKAAHASLRLLDIHGEILIKDSFIKFG